MSPGLHDRADADDAAFVEMRRNDSLMLGISRVTSSGRASFARFDFVFSM